jgi:CRISPR-associated protein Cmr2
MNKTYIALTIGPIYKTFHNVRKTRELWAASFCFSFIMRKINEHLRSKGIASNDFIMPYFDDETLKIIFADAKFNLKGYGMFPDRLIFKKEEGGITLLEGAINFAFDELTNVMEPVIQVSNKEKIKKFLTDYFQLSYIEKSLD